MRACLLTGLLALFAVTSASAQSLMIQGSAGPTITDAGNSVAGNIGLSTSRVNVLFGAERTHLNSRFTSDGRGGGSAFRGGTLTLVEGELQVSLLRRDRVSPYLLVGGGVGESRPNVNDMFPDPVTNDVRAFFAGGGIRVPLGSNVSVFGDARMIVGDEANELLAVAPLRAGLAVRF